VGEGPRRGVELVELVLDVVVEGRGVEVDEG